MKIAIVEFAGRGGLIHYAFQLARALARAGADVTLITDHHYELDALEHPFRLEKLFRLWDPKPPGQTSDLPPARRRLRRALRALLYYREWLRLLGYLRRTRPDVVQFGDIRFASDLVGLLALRAAGLRLADVCHNVHPFATGGGSRGLPRRSRLLRFFFTRIYRCFDRIFVHFDSNHRSFIETYDVAAEDVACIPHGNEALFEELRDPHVSAARLREELSLAPQDRVVLFFGTLSRYKGVDLLLETFAKVGQVEPRARLVLAGFPAPDFDLASHEELVARLNLQARVRLRPGYVESSAVAAWMELAAVVVFPYRALYQSGALHVAHTAGATIVATRVGAMEEVLVHERTGLLVPPEDPVALAAALRRVLGNPELARSLGSAAAQEARQRFDWQRIAPLLLTHYGEPR